MWASQGRWRRPQEELSLLCLPFLLSSLCSHAFLVGTWKPLASLHESLHDTGLYSCPPKHHNKSLLSQTSSCFSFAGLTKISHDALKAYCASLTFQAHILASRKDLRLLFLRLAQDILVCILVEGCASLSLSSTWTAVIAHSHSWAKHCFILSGKDLKQHQEERFFLDSMFHKRT